MLSKRAFLSAGIGATIAASGAHRIARAAGLVYPTLPVRWVVPYTPGGATDVMSRLICQRLGELLGQPFIVENKPGAGSTVGTEAVINAAPDGHTLLLISTANAINASFDKSLRFDFAQAIVPVAGLARIPLVLVVNNDLPVETIPEFIAYAKANPGKLSAASSGVGTSLHLSGELFKALTGANFVHVPYRGSAPALADLMAGHVQLMFDNVTSSAEFIRAGKIRALGVTTRVRSAALPHVPSIADSVPGYETSSFYGVGAPHETPRPIVDLLNREIGAAIADPAIGRALADLGAIALPGNADAFAAMLGEETERWRKVVALSGAHAE
jgi:tripartite-type tricarboxylate transporter receptor subunit TctC